MIGHAHEKGHLSDVLESKFLVHGVAHIRRLKDARAIPFGGCEAKRLCGYMSPEAFATRLF